MNFYVLNYTFIFLCVFGDDHVTCHTRVDDVPSDAGEA